MRAFSLPDWAFYPICGAIAAAMVMFGLWLRPPGSEPVMEEGRLVYRGPALANFITGPGTRVAFVPDYPGGSVARMGSAASIEAANSIGVGLVIPPDFAETVSGRRIRVEAELRRVEDSLETARMAYFSVAAGRSGSNGLRPRAALQAMTGSASGPIPAARPGRS